MGDNGGAQNHREDRNKQADNRSTPIPQHQTRV